MHHRPRRPRRPLVESLELRQLLTAVTVHSARAPESAGRLTFHVTLDAPADHPVSLTYSTLPGTATPTADYTPAHRTLTLPAGQTESDITVRVKNDPLYERRETLSLDLQATGATLKTSSAQGTITNDDTAPTITLKNAHTREGNAGQHAVTLTAKLAAPAGTPITLTYATSDDSPYFGAATAGADYTAAAGRITFLPGQTTQTIVLHVTGDTTPESAETFHVSLSHDDLLLPLSPTGTPSVVTLGSSSPVATSTVTIRNDDKRAHSDAPVLSAAADLTIDENTPSPSLTVTLSKPSSTPVTFRYAAAEAKEPTPPGGFILAPLFNDAPIGSNFTRHAGTVTIPAGQTSATIPLPILNDTQHQPSDTVRVRLSKVQGATLPNGLPTATTRITLTDSDPPFLLTIANPAMLSSAIDTAQFRTIQIQPETLAKSGSGSVVLSQPVTAWPTYPNDGVLHLDNPGVILTGSGSLTTTGTLTGSLAANGSTSVSVGAGTLTLANPYYGDANLDGTVDAADAAILQQSLSDPSTPPSWSTGDFNYDNQITPDDLTLLDRNLGHSLP